MEGVNTEIVDEFTLLEASSWIPQNVTKGVFQNELLTPNLNILPQDWVVCSRGAVVNKKAIGSVTLKLHNVKKVFSHTSFRSWSSAVLLLIDLFLLVYSILL